MPTYPEQVLPPGLFAARPAASSEGRLYYATDTQILYRDTGVAWETYATGGGGGAGFYESYCCVVDEKAQNTAGGGFTSGAWRTRDVNTEQADPDGIAALAGNQITLDAGTYDCYISCPAYYITNHQTRLQNTTGAATLITGSDERAHGGGTSYVQTRSFISGRFTVAGAQALEIQHQCSLTFAAFGFGYPSNFTDEIYTIAVFLKLA